jgi:hypothetical protein
LDIPPWSNPIEKVLAPYWSDLIEVTDSDDRRKFVQWNHLSEKSGLDEERLLALIEEGLDLLEQEPDILESEYRQIVSGQLSPIDQQIEFEVSTIPVPAKIDDHIQKLVAANRLREVRVLKAFTRLHQPGEDGHEAPIFSESPSWLPAVEIRGEGIFVELSTDRLLAWEQDAGVVERTTELLTRTTAENRPSESEPASRMILLHTLGHLLMSELALECGYSQASIRERIYSSAEMAGVLVYTGSPDSEGTLGGLVRQAQGNRFAEVLLGALNRASWCSGDPLCMDGTATLSDSLNMAACHACALSPETSCTEFNRYLDRALVVGLPGKSGVGFFEALI